MSRIATSRELGDAAASIELPDELQAGQAAADDVLDAAIVAWSARGRHVARRRRCRLILPSRMGG